MAGPINSVALISDDPGLRLSVAAMFKSRAEAIDVVYLASVDAIAALRQTAADIVILDADTISDLRTCVGASVLLQPAPVVVMGTNMGDGGDRDTYCRRYGAALIWAKRSGAANPGLAGDEGGRFIAAISGRGDFPSFRSPQVTDA